MLSIARASTDFFDNHVDDDRIHIFNTDDDDFNSVPSASTIHTTSLPCVGVTATENKAECLGTGVLVESSRDLGGRSEQGPRRVEDRPSTTDEREEPFNTIGPQSLTGDEGPAQGADDDETIVEDVNDSNRPQVAAEHPRLPVVECMFNYEDTPTPEISIGNDEDDTQLKFAISYNDEEREGPVVVERVENVTPHISGMGVIVPVDYSQRRKRTRLVFEDDYEADDEADSAQGPDIIPTDAHRAPKRARYAFRTPIDYVEHRNLASRSRRTDFGEFYGHMNLDRASLLGAPTPAPSPSGHVDEQKDEYGDGEEDEEEGHGDGYEGEDEEHGEESEEKGEEDEQEHDGEPSTRSPVIVVEEDEEESEADEGVYADDEI